MRKILFAMLIACVALCSCGTHYIMFSVEGQYSINPKVYKLS